MLSLMHTHLYHYRYHDGFEDFPEITMMFFTDTSKEIKKRL